MKIGDKAVTNGELCEIVAVDREYQYPIPGRYTVRFENGTVIQNYPGYLLKDPQTEAGWIAATVALAIAIGVSGMMLLGVYFLGWLWR